MPGKGAQIPHTIGNPDFHREGHHMNKDPDDTIGDMIRLGYLTAKEGMTAGDIHSNLNNVIETIVGLIYKEARKVPPLQPTLYGIDFKITPSGETKLIEVNGANSGVSGFTSIYKDNRVKETIIERMRAIAGDKKLLVSGSYAYLRKEHFAKEENKKTLSDLSEKNKKAPLYKRLWWWYAKDGPRRIVRHIYRSQAARTMLSSESEREAKDNARLWNGHYREDQRFDDNVLGNALFLKAREELRLRYGEDSWRIEKMIAPFLNSKGEQIADFIDGDDIGLFWDRWSFYFGLMQPGFPVVNPAHHQLVCADKLYQHHVLSKTNIADALVPTMPLGLGIETREGYDAFMQKNHDDILVLKPARGSRGYGVRMLPRKIIESEEDLIGKPISKLVSIEEAWVKLSPYCLDFLNECIEILSPYVPSKEIRSKETGKTHDACMRAIVFNGEFIDAYWRLAPEPLDASCPLEERFRANLSCGAIAKAPRDVELEIAKSFSESVASALDDAMLPYSATSYHTMETQLWWEILEEKHGLKDATRKDILDAAKKKRSELGMYPLTITHLGLLRDTAITAALCTPAVANWLIRYF